MEEFTELESYFKKCGLTEAALVLTGLVMISFSCSFPVAFENELKTVLTTLMHVLYLIFLSLGLLLFFFLKM